MRQNLFGSGWTGIQAFYHLIEARMGPPTALCLSLPNAGWARVEPRLAQPILSTPNDIAFNCLRSGDQMSHVRKEIQD